LPRQVRVRGTQGEVRRVHGWRVVVGEPTGRIDSG
jgi:hypothetical protein